MTVAELIIALQEMPQGAVAVLGYDGQYLKCSAPQVKHLAVGRPTEAWGDYVDVG